MPSTLICPHKHVWMMGETSPPLVLKESINNGLIENWWMITQKSINCWVWCLIAIQQIINISQLLPHSSTLNSRIWELLDLPLSQSLLVSHGRKLLSPLPLSARLFTHTHTHTHTPAYSICSMRHVTVTAGQYWKIPQWEVFIGAVCLRSEMSPGVCAWVWITWLVTLVTCPLRYLTLFI